MGGRPEQMLPSKPGRLGKMFPGRHPSGDYIDPTAPSFSGCPRSHGTWR
jgi:hypothetical protein